MSLFVAGASFGDLGLSPFKAGAVFGDMGLLFDRVGARNAAFFNTRCTRSEPRRMGGGGLRTDRFMVGSWSDHSRIMLRQAAHWNGDFMDFALELLVVVTVCFATYCLLRALDGTFQVLFGYAEDVTFHSRRSMW